MGSKDCATISSQVVDDSSCDQSKKKLVTDWINLTDKSFDFTLTETLFNAVYGI